MKVKLSKSQLGILIAVIILSIILICGGIICVVKDESPSQLITNAFNSKDEKIVGKWQILDNQDLFAYEFLEDGTYKYYFAGFPINGLYEVKGNKLILTNPKVSKKLVYKIKISDKEMTLTKVEEDGEKAEKQINHYKKVDHINLKTLTELANDLKNKQTESVK